MITKPHTSGFKGFILKMANYLRLKADALEPNSFLKVFLISHTSWKEFIPILREETINQLTTQYPAQAPVAVVNHFGFSQDFSSFLQRPPPMKPITAADVSIDLGSPYANDLGFAGVVPFVDSNPPQRKRKRGKRRKKKKGNNNNNSASTTTTTTTNENNNNNNEDNKDKIQNVDKKEDEEDDESEEDESEEEEEEEEEIKEEKNEKKKKTKEQKNIKKIKTTKRRQ